MTLTMLIALSATTLANSTRPEDLFDNPRVRHSVSTNLVTNLGRINIPYAKLGNTVTTARQFVNDHANMWGLNQSGLSIDNASVIRHLRQQIVSFKVLFKNMPVFFRRIQVQVSPDNTIRRVTSAVPSFNNTPSKHPGVDKTEITRWGEKRELEISAITPGWLPDTRENLKPVIRFDAIKFNHSNEPVTYFLSAYTMKVVYLEPAFDTNTPMGSVFKENPVTTPIPITEPLLSLEAPFDKLYGDYAHVERCIDQKDCKESQISATPNSTGNFEYKPNLEPDTFDDPFSEVNAYRNISAINAWVRKTFGWDYLFNDETWLLVKVGRAWYNAAFYRGNKDTAPHIIFGQDLVDMAYDSDVAHHEFGHAINRSLHSHPWFIKDQFGANFAPFGLEEGSADIWAQTFGGDPVMNSYVTVTRTADNNLLCPNDLQGEGHMEARIISAVGWNIRKRIGADAWNQIVYRTLLLLKPSADFGDWVLELAASAEDLADEGNADVLPQYAQIIIEEGAARGLLEIDCQNRIVPLPDNYPRRVYGYGRKSTNKHNQPMGLQWKVTVPEGIKSIRLYFKWRYPDDVDPGYTVHIARNTPVKVTWLDVDEIGKNDPEFEVNADMSVEGAPEKIIFPTDELEPLAPGEEVYVLLSADADTGTLVVDTKAFFLPDQPITLIDAGPTDSTQYHMSATSGTPSCSQQPANEPFRTSIIAQLYLLF